MATSLSDAPDQATPARTTRRNITWFIAGPITALVARTMWMPFNDEEPALYIAEVAKNTQRSSVGALLMILSALLLIPAAFALASILRDTKPRLARTAVGMIVTGAVGMAAFSMIGVFSALVAAHPDRTVMLSLWDMLVADSKGEAIFSAILTGAIGFVVLAVGLFRSHVVPGAAAVLVGLGGAATLFTTGGPLRPLLMTAAALALAGFGWAASSSRDEPARAGQR